MEGRKATIAIIGAGPLGIELAICLKLAGISYIHFDKKQVAQAIFDFPMGTRFFSSTERIGIAGIPIQTEDQQKCSREEYLNYIRSVVSEFQLNIKTYEEVINIQKGKDNFVLTTTKGGYEADFIVIATGGTSFSRQLNVPGEDLLNVHWQLADPHVYFQKRVLIVGGRNSAAEAALRCYHAKANVILSTRKKNFTEIDIKYWLLPELLGRIERKEIVCFYESEVLEIFPQKVVLNSKGSLHEIETDFVIKAIGFDADLSLLKKLGTQLQGEQQAPFHNLATMETNVSNLYILGTIVGGTQKRYRVFIENTHVHVDKILKSLSLKLGINMHPAVTNLKTTEQLEE